VAVGKDFRTTGAFGEANQYAVFIVILAPLAINGFIRYKQKIFKIIMAIISFTSIFCLFLTGSRGGLVALFVGVVSLLHLNSGKISIRSLLKNFSLITVVVLFIAIVFYTLPKASRQGIEKNVVTRAQKGDDFKTDYTSGRFKIWKRCLDVFIQNPILGSGWNTIHYKVGKNSHNEYLLYLTTTGIIGFSLFVFLFYRLYQSAIKFRRASKTNIHFYDSYLAGLLSFMTAMVFVNIYNPYFFLFIYSGLILKLGYLETIKIQRGRIEHTSNSL